MGRESESEHERLIKCFGFFPPHTLPSTYQNLEEQHLQQNSTSFPPVIRQRQLLNSAFP